MYSALGVMMDLGNNAHSKTALVLARARTVMVEVGTAGVFKMGDDADSSQVLNSKSWILVFPVVTRLEPECILLQKHFM